MATVSLRNVNKVYSNGVQAVYDFNLDIKDGEFIVFVGPSGCGKSTTLRMIAGLEEITNGELYIDGELMNDIAPKDRDLAMVFQSYALYPHMTVYKNMAFGLQLRHLPKDEIDRKVRSAAEILGLTSYLDRKPKALSGGQRQRVALGRAIVREAKVFLMDEPLSNLDAKLRVLMRSEIIKLHQKLNTTFIYVTHDQIEAMTMADRIVVMKDGYIMQVGTPKYIYDNPRNVFVGGFVGTPPMNFIVGKVSSDGYFYVADKRLKLPQDKFELVQKNNKIDQEIYLGIRPEHIILSDKTEENTLMLTIEVAELLGQFSNIYTSIGDNNLVISLPPLDKLVAGEMINLEFKLEKSHLYDKETEKVLE